MIKPEIFIQIAIHYKKNRKTNVMYLSYQLFCDSHVRNFTIIYSRQFHFVTLLSFPGGSLLDVHFVKNSFSVKCPENFNSYRTYDFRLFFENGFFNTHQSQDILSASFSQFCPKRLTTSSNTCEMENTYLLVIMKYILRMLW